MKDIIVDECCIQGVACHIIKEMKDWEKAKMLLNILNPDEIKEEQLREYVNALGKNVIREENCMQKH